jgi:DMSO/TMAO reductase YedYZ molybdopterin-dependent catalytic subunit/thiosulfate reductase cytochrome b subunit
MPQEDPVPSSPVRVQQPRMIRIIHWVNAASVMVLLVSGIAILIAHPRLYWGEGGYFGEAAVIDLPLDINMEHTGWGRNLHFLAAWLLVINGVLYLGYSLMTGHLRRDLMPARAQLGWRRLFDDIRRHLRHPITASEAGYHAIQRLAYLAVIFFLLPTMALTGLAMSPGVTAAVPWLPVLMAGHQSARTLHFLISGLLVLFVWVHVAQVVRAGRADSQRDRKSALAGEVVSNVAVSRRSWMISAGVTAGLALVSLVRWPLPVRASGLFGLSDTLTFWTQRLLLSRQPLAKEFSVGDISPNFPAINTIDPEDETYQRQRANGFAEWHLSVTGLVTRPTVFSLADLQTLPARTQITQHSCEQGWSAIAQWTGVPLSLVLEAVGLRPPARFVVFRCVDGWWDSLDLFDALHPQTLLAYGMNGQPLPVQHGAPVRLRVERQLGYKSLKYVSSIEVVESVENIGEGRGSGVAEEGYNWYAGI